MPRKKINIVKAKSGYLAIGHDGYSRGKFNEKKPNYIWIFEKGKIDTREETSECYGHGSVGEWNFSDFSGRYDAKKKVISCVIHVKSITNFRELPKTLVEQLYQHFPKAKKIVVFD
jgi:hypothetical protein